jgi:predicted Rossmann fold nucleotide-binding protein DprA/Smf involved in DNA uptake
MPDVGRKTSIVPQMDFLMGPCPPQSHAPTALTGQRNKNVLERVVACQQIGATADEVAQELGLICSDVSPRLAELSRLGHVRRTESRRNGKIVWMAVTAGEGA